MEARSRSTDDGDLVSKTTHDVPSVGEQIHELDDSHLGERRAVEDHIDRSGAPRGRVDRMLHPRSPTSGLSECHDRRLPAKVGDVTR